MRRNFWAAALVLGIAGVGAAPAAAEPLVFAAASTARAMDEVIAASGVAATLSYGPSGTLARQIAAGAPADLFLSANPRWMAFLVDEGVVAPEAVTALLSNALVIIAQAGAPPVALEATVLDERLDGEQFAMADPTTAPVGEYGRAALETLGLWASVAPHHVPTRNTLITVATVDRGEAVLGLVYRSDALGIAGVEIAAELPSEAHPPIEYPAARLAGGSDSAGAAELLAFLTTAEAQAIFERHGFEVLEPGP